MGQALYRKYRSRKLDEIVGQSAVTTALSNALASGNLSHAYLFTGPRGVGKTSIARILAHEINNIPYDTDELPLDIIEIDAASNRRIEEIRDLREKVRIAPVSAKYKIYIIDEVHMLTRDSFNALLKTLEEPPAHVIFILATTEAHKLPETIISRTQRYTFKLASQEEVSKHLSKIAHQEAIDISSDAIDLLALHSGGSLRDALSLLDQVRHSGSKIDANIVRLNLGLPSENITTQLLGAIQSGEPSAIIESLQIAKESGASAQLIAEQLLQTIRNQLTQGKTTLDMHQSLKFAQSLLTVESSNRPEIQLEIVLIGCLLDVQPRQKIQTSPELIQSVQPPLTVSEPANEYKKSHTPPVSKENNIIKPAVTSAAETSNTVVGPQELSEDVWSQALSSIKQTHNTIYSILRMAQPDFSNIADKQFKLLFKFPFHQKRMNESKNKQIVTDVLTNFGVDGYEILCDVLPKDAPDNSENNQTVNFEPTKPEIESNLLGQIRNVFGGAEVLE